VKVFTRSVVVLVGAAVGLSGCATATSASRLEVAHQVVSLDLDVDPPWGTVPVARPDSARSGWIVTGLLGAPLDSRSYVSLHSLNFNGSSFDERMDGAKETARWRTSPIQGTLQLDYATSGLFRAGGGAQLSRSPSAWIGIGIMERGRSAMLLFADGDLGFSWNSARIGLATIRTVSRRNEITGFYSSSSDTSFSTETFQTSSFLRLTLGMVPSGSGPWFMGQLMPEFTLARWPGRSSYEIDTLWNTSGLAASDPYIISIDTLRTGDVPARLRPLLGSFALGWCQRFGDRTVILGIRHDMGMLDQWQVLGQLSVDL